LHFTGDGIANKPSAGDCLPGAGLQRTSHVNPNFVTSNYRYAYQSLVTPSSVYEYDVTTGESKLLKQLEVPGGFDRTLYASERLFATAADGVQIPVSLVIEKTSSKRSGKSTLCLWLPTASSAIPADWVQQQSSEPALSRGFVLASTRISAAAEIWASHGTSADA